ncbi:MAG: hypothetical protein WCF65_09695, partial [Parachlamydiaceae bacterium]
SYECSPQNGQGRAHPGGMFTLLAQAVACPGGTSKAWEHQRKRLEPRRADTKPQLKTCKVFG